MNHRPFEDWLLDDHHLDPQQQRDLQNHLRDCVSCSAIAESNLALRGTRMLSPQPGFTDRFAVRLARRRREQRWRQVIGTVLLVLMGVGLTAFFAGPILEEALSSPAAWLTAVVGYFLFIITSLQVLGEAGEVLLRVIPSFISPAGWFVSVLVLTGLAFVWVLTIRRLAHVPQGV